MNMSSGRVKVLCERIMSRGYEPRVSRLMEKVKAVVRAQPGFVSIDTYAQIDDQTKYVVFSEWKSKKDLDTWLASEEFQTCTQQINELLDVPGLNMRVFKIPKDNVFLL
ncbi:antibiotic biosynthesis monooxygenase [Plasmopara halstedii]|uniref:Antibiotic biosynthesis monooxygenase n=1 Tax=Plasmopara halstedii TaxID=4781 RepID=A0A0P1AIH6_PLAHL|nr:antibiotic biosynthesis monooxygenase [Plasmopara halstedii]CEG40308.1 antibiotic biosynthesis monooxygenase [Plasmopara halstedii]|eukprot:XP_024576677.1 antibiotic biosynthesis monooxygenase [Plasmopara halstedii]